MNLITIPREITKKELDAQADKIAELVYYGNHEPLDVYVQLKAYEEIIKRVKEKIKGDVIESAEKYIKDDLYPVKVEISNTGSTLDYDNDAEYSDIKSALELRKNKLKDAWMKSQIGMTLVDDTGEAVPVCPVKKESESIVKITFKK